MTKQELLALIRNLPDDAAIVFKTDIEYKVCYPVYFYQDNITRIYLSNERTKNISENDM